MKWASNGISILHSDGALEYRSIKYDFGGAGDIRESIQKSYYPPNTTEHNSIAEPFNRTMIEDGRFLLIQADLPKCLWPYALKHATYVRSRLKHSTTGVIPYLRLTGSKPSFKMFKYLVARHMSSNFLLHQNSSPKHMKEYTWKPCHTVRSVFSYTKTGLIA